MTSFLDRALDAAVVPGFSRIGFALRSRIEHWVDIEAMQMTGRTVVITGPTSGLGAETSRMLVRSGAHVVLVGRNPAKCEATAAELRALRTDAAVDVVCAEMGDLGSVAAASREIARRFPRIDVLVHNAGALLNERGLSPQGIEQTVASHVVGPHLMTSILRDSLRATHGRVVTVSSGGMYAAPLPQLQKGDSLEMTKYDGTRQYAIAKRAQVTLNSMWAQHEPDVEFAAMHPGWADTPGVQESIPLFRTLTRPILRTVAQGADTIAWLAAVKPLPHGSGLFWCDRQVRGVHKVSSTRRSDNPEARDALWNWCNETIRPFLTV